MEELSGQEDASEDEHGVAHSKPEPQLIRRNLILNKDYQYGSANSDWAIDRACCHCTFHISQASHPQQKATFTQHDCAKLWTEVFACEMLSQMTMPRLGLRTRRMCSSMEAINGVTACTSGTLRTSTSCLSIPCRRRRGGSAGTLSIPTRAASRTTRWSIGHPRRSSTTAGRYLCPTLTLRLRIISTSHQGTANCRLKSLKLVPQTSPPAGQHSAILLLCKFLELHFQ